MSAEPTEPTEEGVYCVGLPVGVAFLDDGTIIVTVFAEDLTAALSEDDATPEHIAAASAFLDRGTALIATHQETP